MPDHFTTRLALPYPDIDDPANVPADMQQLAERLDVLIPAGSGAGLALNRVTIGDVGMAGQVRAGRTLTAADFTNLGLAAPLGLWNLSDLTDVSGNARALTNKGAVTFATGINGAAASAAQFTGSTAQALYIADTGAADPFRIKTGSFGCWFRTAKRTGSQTLMSKISAAAGNYSWQTYIQANVLIVWLSLDGSSGVAATGLSDVADDRWHHGVFTFDGATLRGYVDGVLETTVAASGTLFAGNAPLNIGGGAADGATAAVAPHFGRVDEAFVTADVLSDDQVRNLYCARVAHTLGVVPTAAKLNVTRRRRGGAWAVADFPVQPLRLYNLTNGVGTDQGSNNVALTGDAQTGITVVAGADGARAGAQNFAASGHVGNMGTDAGLPQGAASRSYGCWLKAVPGAAVINVMAWGTPSTGDARMYLDTSGVVTAVNAADVAVGPYVRDGLWHLVIVTEENAPLDGVKRKLYVDGRLGGSSVSIGALVLTGANGFRIGANSTGGGPFTGQIDGAFVTDVVLTAAQIAALYAKGSQALTPSPKNAGDHVEAWDAAAVYATFDTLDSNWQVDLGVAA